MKIQVRAKLNNEENNIHYKPVIIDTEKIVFIDKLNDELTYIGFSALNEDGFMLDLPYKYIEEEKDYNFLQAAFKFYNK